MKGLPSGCGCESHTSRLFSVIRNLICIRFCITCFGLHRHLGRTMVSIMASTWHQSVYSDRRDWIQTTNWKFSVLSHFIFSTAKPVNTTEFMGSPGMIIIRVTQCVAAPSGLVSCWSQRCPGTVSVAGIFCISLHTCETLVNSRYQQRMNCSLFDKMTLKLGLWVTG